jgi:hypothetical protein
VARDAHRVVHELLPDRGLDAIAADDRRPAMEPGPFESIAFTPLASCSIRSIVRRGDELDVSARLHRVVQRLMDVGAVAHGVGISEALAKRLTHGHRCDLGAVDRVHHHEALRVDRLCARAFAHAKRVECGERVGTELDAGADLADLRRLLEHFHCVTAAREAQARRRVPRCRRRR